MCISCAMSEGGQRIETSRCHVVKCSLHAISFSQFISVEVKIT